MIKIDLATARRYILGKQGLWPGRRWRGIQGVEAAIRAGEYLQLDPLQIIARSQDIQLHSRVLDYTPGMWEEAAYQQRKFFDWGGWLAVRPMDELPHWLTVMRRERDGSVDTDRRIRGMAGEYAGAISEMRSILAERGTVSNRDFEKTTRTSMMSYRGGKESSLALYYLWRTGEVMTHHRENFERVYALTEAVAPAHLLQASSEDAADRFLVRKDVAFAGLARLNRTADAYFRGVPFSRIKQVLTALQADGELIEVQVEGWKPVHYALAGDAGLMEDLASGRVPAEWTPLESGKSEEVIFLAPLDPVSARGRAKLLFGFDYIWEVYKPEAQRRYGYYTLPVLWGDLLVARFDSRFDRAAKTLVILGFWLDDHTLANNSDFANALGRGFDRFAAFLGAVKITADAIQEGLLRKRVLDFE